MSIGRRTFDRKGHTQASTPEDLADNPYTSRNPNRGSLGATLAVTGLATAALVYSLLNHEGDSKSAPIQQPDRSITPEGGYSTDSLIDKARISLDEHTTILRIERRDDDTL